MHDVDFDDGVLEVEVVVLRVAVQVDVTVSAKMRTLCDTEMRLFSTKARKLTEHSSSLEQRKDTHENSIA